MRKIVLMLLLITVITGFPVGDARSDDALAGEYMELGLSYVDDENYRFTRYNGLVGEDVFPLLNLRLSSQPLNEPGYWDFVAMDIGRETMRLRAEAGQQDQQVFVFQYREIPYYIDNTARSPFTGNDTARLRLPIDWQVSGDSTQTMTTLNEHLHAVDIRHSRERLQLSYQKALDAAWELQAGYRRELKQGQSTAGAAIGVHGGNTRAVILPFVLDYATDVFELGVRAETARYRFDMGYYASFFNNGSQALSWQNPFARHPQWADGVAYPDGYGRMALSPDNRFQQLQLSAHYRASAGAYSRLHITQGRMQQDSEFLPYTINPALQAPVALPRDSLNGRIDTRSVDLQLNFQPARRMNIVAVYCMDERDNQTPRDVYLPVPGDAQAQVAYPEGRYNRPYSFNEQTYKLHAQYHASNRVGLRGGYTHTIIERDYAEVNDSVEHIYSAGMRITANAYLNFALDYQYQQRDTGDYVANRPLLLTHVPGTVDSEDFVNHPLLRKYYLTDRGRDHWQLRADAMIGDTFNLNLSAAYNQDKYHASIFGLREAVLRAYTFDAAFIGNQNMQLNAFYTLEYYETEQAGRAFAAVPAQILDAERNWNVLSHDRFSSAGLTLRTTVPYRLAAVFRNWEEAGLDIVYSRSHEDLQLHAGPAVPGAPLPELYDRMNSYRFYAHYRLSGLSQLRFILEHERYDSADFTLDNVYPSTIAAVLTLGRQSPRYAVNSFGFSYVRRFN